MTAVTITDKLTTRTIINNLREMEIIDEKIRGYEAAIKGLLKIDPNTLSGTCAFDISTIRRFIDGLKEINRVCDGIISNTSTSGLNLCSVIGRISALKRYTYWPEQGCTGSNAFVQYDTGEWIKTDDLHKILADIKKECGL